MLPYRDGSGPVVLFSHGNAVDLGIMMPFYADLVSLLHINVCSYDYTGYGESSGSPTVSNTLDDIQVCVHVVWLYSVCTYGKVYTPPPRHPRACEHHHPAIHPLSIHPRTDCTALVVHHPQQAATGHHSLWTKRG